MEVRSRGRVGHWLAKADRRADQWLEETLTEFLHWCLKAAVCQACGGATWFDCKLWNYEIQYLVLLVD